MRANTGYFPVESSAPLRGLATSPPSNKIPPAFSPRLLNVMVRDGIVRRRPGGVQLGQRLMGEVMVITEFGPLTENPYCLVLTSKRQYWYDPNTEKFVDLTPNQLTYAITAVDNTGPTYSFTIAGDHTSEFAADFTFPVVGGVHEGVYTVVSATLDTGNTVIVVSETITSATVAGDIVLADELTTQDDDFISYVSITDVNSHRFLFTNGRDPPRVWDGDTGTDFADWAPSYTDFVTCRLLCVFAEHLFLGDVTTTSANPLLVSWSSAGDFDEFIEGDTGSQLLYQLKTRPRAMRVLGDRLVIYSEDSIVTGVNVGYPAIFAFETVIPEGTRLASQNGILSVNVGHIYLAEENVYLFDGSRGMRVLGDAIYTDYKNIRDRENLFKTTCLNDFSKRTMFFSVPDISGGTIIYTGEYDVFNLSNIVWSKEKYYDTVRCWGFFVNRDVTVDWEDVAWETVDSPWENELGNWSEESEQINYPIRSYGTPEGRVVIVTEGILTDRDNPVEQSYETKDFEVPEIGNAVFGRWGEIEAQLEGTSVLVEYSGDGGQNFIEANEGEELELTGAPVDYQIPIDIVSRTLRVRFSSSTNFKLRSVRVWVKPGEPQ